MGADFLTIGITSPEEWSDLDDEAEAIAAFLTIADGSDAPPIDLIHLRKPDGSSEYVKSLIKAIPENLHSRIILHTHRDLLDSFTFGGMHFRPGDSEDPREFHRPESSFRLTRSCHQLLEISDRNAPLFSYSFLSPIFDSISKEGYLGRFDLDDKELRDTLSLFPIVALGGVKPEFFQILFDAKFAGAALLGYLWSPNLPIGVRIQSLLEAKHNLKQ